MTNPTITTTYPTMAKKTKTKSSKPPKMTKKTKTRKTRKPKNKPADTTLPIVVMTIKGTGQMVVQTTDAKFVVMTSSKDVVGAAGCAVVVDTIDIEPMVVDSVVKTSSKDAVDATGGASVGDDSITKRNPEQRAFNQPMCLTTTHVYKSDGNSSKRSPPM
jgi:hypothetical protein